MGFAGKRQIFPSGSQDSEKLLLLHDAVAGYLEQRLRALPAELGLDPEHPICGLSQIAIGADMLFARACQAIRIPQRIFLPQGRQEYLSAVDSTGIADFAPSERAEAESLLVRAEVIEERVVSGSPDRNTRFEETNLEILRASDLVLCLLTDEHDVDPNQAVQRGGTKHLLELAIQYGTPALEIRVGLGEGMLKLSEQWHPDDAPTHFHWRPESRIRAMGE